MLDAIAKLLVLQDRDRKLRRAEAELANIEPERQTFKTKSLNIQAQLDVVRLRVKQIESDRKRLELDVEAKKPHRRVTIARPLHDRTECHEWHAQKFHPCRRIRHCACRRCCACFHFCALALVQRRYLRL